MPNIQKIGKMNAMMTRYDADRLPNISLGRHCRVNTNNILMKDNRLNKYVNDKTMGALDNYAHREGMKIYITPLENDMFHDVAVSVYNKGNDHDLIAKFPVKINDGRHGLSGFLTELNSRIAPQKPLQKLSKSDKPTKLDDFKVFVGEKIDYVKNFRINMIRKFIENNSDGNGIKRTIADVFENVYYNQLYK